jgi:hypothetical protein
LRSPKRWSALSGQWRVNPDDTASQKLQRFFLEYVCMAFPAPAPIAVFLDEIDSTLKLPFTDGLFAAIRGMYNERGLVGDYNRVAFCLIGVATPNELIKDRRTTVYNVGKTLALRDFQAGTDDLSPLAASLADDRASGEVLLDRVLYWTDGQPYLTIRLCAALANKAAHADDVDKRVEQESRSIDEMRTDAHFQQVLRFVDVRFTHGSASLALYAKILRGEHGAGFLFSKLTSCACAEGCDGQRKSEIPTGTADQELFSSAPRSLNAANPLHQALLRWERVIGAKSSGGVRARNLALAAQRGMVFPRRFSTSATDGHGPLGGSFRACRR